MTMTREPHVTVSPSPFVVTNSGASQTGVTGVSRTIVAPPAQSPKIQIGSR